MRRQGSQGQWSSRVYYCPHFMETAFTLAEAMAAAALAVVANSPSPLLLGRSFDGRLLSYLVQDFMFASSQLAQFG